MCFWIRLRDFVDLFFRLVVRIEGIRILDEIGFSGVLAMVSNIHDLRSARRSVKLGRAFGNV